MNVFVNWIGRGASNVTLIVEATVFSWSSWLDYIENRNSVVMYVLIFYIIIYKSNILTVHESI